MTVYILNIILLIIFGLLFLGYKPDLNKKKIFCIIATIQWILISGLRHISVGPDTANYQWMFEQIKNYNLIDLIDQFIQGVFLVGDFKDPGYSIFEKISQFISDEYQIFLFIIAILFMIPLGKMIYKYSKNPFISFLIYSVLFYSFYSITGHRQTVATAIALLIGYPLLRDRHMWKYFFLVILAATIHKSAIVLIPFYFIANKKITFKYSMLMCSMFIILFIFRSQFIGIVGNLIGYEQYINQYEGAGTQTFTMFFIGIVCIAIWKHKQIFSNQSSTNTTIWYNAMFFALLFIPLTYIDPSTMRVVQYFSIFTIFLIPELIKTFSVKEQLILYYVGSVLLILLLIRNSPQYLFFWQ